MLNRPQNAFTETRGEPASWDVDERPELRLLWLFLLMMSPVVVIALRMVYVQSALAEEYLAAFQVETSIDEPIPKRDGRILSADGRVLADDLPQFDLLVHYRWAESPPNAGWLKQQALAQLERKDRRDKHKLLEAQQAVVAQRNAMWDRLALLTNTPSAQLRGLCDGLQQRVERISSRLEWNRQELGLSNRASEDDATPTDVPGWWKRAYRTAVEELTTPPRRESNDPLIVKEELSHHLILSDVPLAVAAEIQAHPDQYPGLKVTTSSLRVYPQKDLAPHLIGTRMPISDEELSERRTRFDGKDPLDYAVGDRIGKSGVELAYDSRLRGVRGVQRTVRNRRGKVIRTEILREPRLGQDLVLTLHLDLQQRLERLLDHSLQQAISGESEGEGENRSAAGGCIIALDVHTGAVLAAASAPRYDLDLFIHPDEEKWKKLLDDPRRPFFHRATQMALPPGSVFKALTSIAFLESGKVDPDERISCVGYLDNPNRHRCFIYNHFGVGHGETDLSDALAQSCNVYFFANARKIGPDPMIQWADRFGFGQPTGIDIPGEQGGHVPRPSMTPTATRPAQSAALRKWQSSDTLGFAIGQSRLLVTPMQVARLMAAIANGGKLVTPHVVRQDQTTADASIPDSPGQSTRANEPSSIPELRPGTLERVREGLEKVVADRRGTGYKTVRMKDVAIAGKTGTAEVGGGKPDHAWFAGYLPAERPRIAFVVVLEHGGSGGRAAGPVAKEFAQTLLELGILHASTLTRREEGNER